VVDLVKSLINLDLKLLSCSEIAAAQSVVETPEENNIAYAGNMKAVEYRGTCE
jgi:hypothetical protein